MGGTRIPTPAAENENETILLGTNKAQAWGNSVANRFAPLFGDQTIDGTENNTKNQFSLSYRLSKFSVLITANSGVSPTVFVIRKNGADTVLTFTVPAGATGFFEDTTHSVDFDDNDDVNIRTSPVATGTVSGNGSSIDMEKL